MRPRLLERYRKDVVARLSKEFSYGNVHQVPKLEKIVVNIGLGEATLNPKLIDNAVVELAAITGQKPAVRRARKSIANFKLRQGQRIGAMVTLRGDRMWEFLDRKEVPEASIVIRIPAERLDEALALIKKDAVDVQYENRSGQDVTNAYVDLQSQLRAKQVAEEQLLEIMEDATRAEDVLAVYMQVQAIQTEIEQLKGQIKYYDEAVELSSVSVRLIAEESTQPIEVGPWKPAGAAKQAIEDLIVFVQNFVDFLIRFAIYILPALLLIALPLLLVFLAGRAIYRRTRKPKASVEETDIDKQ